MRKSYELFRDTPLGRAAEKAGMSADDLATKAGVSRATIYRAAHGMTQPHGLVLAALAAAFGHPTTRRVVNLIEKGRGV